MTAMVDWALKTSFLPPFLTLPLCESRCSDLCFVRLCESRCSDLCFVRLCESRCSDLHFVRLCESRCSDLCFVRLTMCCKKLSTGVRSAAICVTFFMTKTLVWGFYILTCSYRLLMVDSVSRSW